MPRKPKPRFIDPGTLVYDLLDVVQVCCPECGDAAMVVTRRAERSHAPWWADRHVVCDRCGVVREWSAETGGEFRFADGLDPWFGLPVLLRAPAAGHVLWAYNLAHLDLIESFVRAEIRLTGGRPDGVTTVAQKFPPWLVAAGSRERVLMAIRRMRMHVPLVQDAAAH